MKYFKLHNLYYRQLNTNQPDVWRTTGNFSEWAESLNTEEQFISGKPDTKPVTPKLMSCTICNNTGCHRCRHDPFSIYNKFRNKP